MKKEILGWYRDYINNTEVYNGISNTILALK